MDLFGTAGIRGSARERVTPELALAVGRAVGRDADEVVVGRDGRTTGPALAAAVEAGLLSAGATVRRVGVVPTPALASASRGRRGVMLTASHNPPTDNGIKLFVNGVEYDREAERRIDRRVEADEPSAAWDEWADSSHVDPLPDYRESVVAYAETLGAPADDLRVAVDCGNGMSAVGTPQVLRDLGASVVTLNANVDGHFPGRESKPTPESLADLRAFVADGDFDLGVGHDGDADRIVIVDGTGEVIHEDTVVAILAERYVRTAEAADPVVVTTPNASARIDERVRAAGGRVERVRLGALHEGIARVRREGGEDTAVVFAAEPWKHVHTRFGGWIDGICSAAVLSRLVAESGLSALREPVTERPYRKVSVSCPDDAKSAVMADLTTSLPEAFPEAEVDTDHGVRLELPDSSWVLVRPSGTEPYVRVYAESDEVDELIDAATDVVESVVAAN
ncbi:phosphopentomutase/phosphoglucosamine mutase [Salinirubrum litoreum]|uniref:Phosphopentomutase/phosphoglucosamine mutase n=1 Tax=Salinirubrum litoreum TaxID=1126234 RepID=A0ABD5R8G1_9EURY|nr:phosphopentomutase/phosphoglucosamine mutase [Salinirubrum litoreum]